MESRPSRIAKKGVSGSVAPRRRDARRRRAAEGLEDRTGILLGSARLGTGAAIAIGVFLAILIIPTTLPTGAVSILMGIGLSIGGGLSVFRPIPGGILIGLMLTLAILDPASSPGLGVLVPPISLAACAGAGRLVPAILLGLWNTVVITIAAQLTTDTTADLVTNALVWIFLLAAAYLLGAMWRSMILRLSAERARHAFDLAEQRRAIARDLHDTGVRAITEVILIAETAQHAEGVTAADAEAFARISRTARLSTDDLRTLMESLRTDEPFEQPQFGPTVHAASWDDALQAARDRLIAAGFTVNLSSESDAPVPAAAMSTLSPCLWEAVANVIRHADGDFPVAIMAETAPDGVELLVRNTIDHDPVVSVSGGVGLRGLHERLAAAGGTMEAQRDGDMFLTRFHLPLTPTG